MICSDGDTDDDDDDINSYTTTETYAVSVVRAGVTTAIHDLRRICFCASYLCYIYRPLVCVGAAFLICRLVMHRILMAGNPQPFGQREVTMHWPANKSDHSEHTSITHSAAQNSHET